MKGAIPNKGRWALAILVLAALSVAVLTTSGPPDTATREAAALQLEERKAYDRTVADEALASQARSDARDRAAMIKADRLMALQAAHDATAAKAEAARQAMIDLEDGTAWRNRDAYMPDRGRVPAG